ncbi:hypothetical protein CASFOL_010779 [Castilleja foliolosa]|uniref:Cucumisin n=1 Tax=Castilleja foliolosa TaxID=1961234 RepID=A0ABD3DUP0_9LAMI
MGGSYLLFGFIVNLLLFSFLGEANVNEAKSESENRVYIVYMGGKVCMLEKVCMLSFIASSEISPIVHTYNKSFMGFAARLSDEEAKSIARRHGVVSVIPDKVSQIHTTRSWNFLRSQNVAFRTDDSPSQVSNWPTRADTIIGIIDTGIWLEHPSFSDEHMGPIPSRWNGTCMPGENSTSPFKCNRKVIGARYYDNPDKPGSITTALDIAGHGTHVASIAAGRHVLGWASYNGLAQGFPRGGSPESRIAVYCVCEAGGDCSDSGILRAFDDAIADGVDVISISISGEYQDFLNDTLAIGAFHAVEKGVTVVSVVGNDGPSLGTAQNVAPWILTVGATTIDRDFQADIVLGDGNKKIIIKGGGINFSGLNKSAVYPLVDGRSAGSNQLHDVANARCSLNDGKVKGSIVLCESKDHNYGAKEKFKWLKEHGAIGLILISNFQRQVAHSYGTSPIAIVDQGDGALIRSYIDSTSNPLATILPTVTVLNHKPAPVAAYFSSRGPGLKNLLKPDVAAPGVDILGAWLNHTSLAIPGKKQPIFNIVSGTSQACPHVLWSSCNGQVLASEMESVRYQICHYDNTIQTNNIHEPITTETGSRATPYDIGAGEISLFGPFCPGLVYETDTIDYIKLLCNLGYKTSVVKSVATTIPTNFSCPSKPNPDLVSDMNYPSIVVSGLKSNKSKTVIRTVTNVGEEYSTYTASVEAPAGIHIQVVPNKLHFTKEVTKQSFQVTFINTSASVGPLFCSLTWSNWKYKVRSPLVISNE